MKISSSPILIDMFQFLNDSPAKTPVVHSFQFVHVDSKKSQHISPLLGCEIRPRLILSSSS